MPGRRATTAPDTTPLEETTPTAPATPAPEPQPEAEPLPPSDLAPEPEERNLRVFGWTGFPGRIAGFGSVAAAEGDYPLTVHEAITEVTRQVGAVAKTGTADARSGGYKFRGIDDVLAALHPILGDVGLVLLPGRIVEHRREVRATSGSPLNVSLLRVRYTLVGPDGSKLSGEAWGEGADTGDKGTQKAMSQAYKSFALQTFSIPTEDSSRDEPDATNPASRPFTAEEQQRAQTAWQAALNAPDLGSLVGVRRRAEHLLPVPVDATGDGTVAPLSYWLDRRRTELEGVQP